MKLTTALRSSIAQSIIADMAKGTLANPKIQIYAGTIPASLGGTITDTLLAELETTATVAAESNGTITFDEITDDSSANADGVAGWARLLDRDGAESVYLTVTEAGGGGDIEMNTLDIAAGGPVAISSGTITVGGA